MNTSASASDVRRDAASIAFAILQLEEPLTQLSHGAVPEGQPRLGVDAYEFLPSWHTVPTSEVVSFLVGLPSPALLSPTTTRGLIALLLLDELAGERRKWGEKTLTNFTHGFDQLCAQCSLSERSRFLLAIEGSETVYSWAAVREWTQQFGVQVGWSIAPLAGDPRAEAQFVLHRSDGSWLNAEGRGKLRPPPWGHGAT